MKQTTQSPSQWFIKLSAACLLLAGSHTSAIASSIASQAPQAIKTKIDNYLSELVDKNFNGSVLVEYQGKKLLSKGYGKTEPNQATLNTPDTVYDLLSVSKQFTGAAIVKLESQGKLKTDDKLSKYIANLSTDKSTITIHQLLTHSAGFVHDVGGDYDATSKKQYIAEVMHSELLFKPGSSHQYSNVGYSLLGIVIEKASGMAYEDYLYKHLFKPAGMENTGYARPNFKPNKTAASMSSATWGKPNDQQWDNYGPYWHLKANGGILTTTEDLYKWHKALGSNKVLSLESRAKLFYPHISEGFEDIASFYSYGWVIAPTPRGTEVIWHDGGNPAFSSEVKRFVDEQAAIFILSNVSDGFSYEIGRQIEGMLFDPTYKPTPKHSYIPLNSLLEQGKSVDDIVAFIKQQYELLRQQKHHSDYALSNRHINRFGYDLVEQNKLSAAKKVFKLNTELHPKSSNAFDSFGEILLQTQNTQAGLKAYKMALKLNPGYDNAANARKVIEMHKSL